MKKRILTLALALFVCCATLFAFTGCNENLQFRCEYEGNWEYTVGANFKEVTNKGSITFYYQDSDGVEYKGITFDIAVEGGLVGTGIDTSTPTAEGVTRTLNVTYKGVTTQVKYVVKAVS